MESADSLLQLRGPPVVSVAKVLHPLPASVLWWLPRAGLLLTFVHHVYDLAYAVSAVCSYASLAAY